MSASSSLPRSRSTATIGFVNVIPTTPWIGTPAHPRMIVIRMDDKLEFVPAEVSVTPGETNALDIEIFNTDAVLAPGDQVVVDQHRFLVEAPGLPARGQDEG